MTSAGDSSSDPLQAGRPSESDDAPSEPADPAARLKRAITAVAGGCGPREELDAAAHELVEMLRQSVDGPEQVLIQIKAILAAAGLRPASDPTGPSDPAAGRQAAIYREVIASSIRSYYAMER